MTQINDKNYLRLIDAIFQQAIDDIITAWRFYEKYGKVPSENEPKSKNNKRHKITYNYNSAVSFLKQSEKGKRILKLLTEVDADEYQRLLKSGVHNNTTN